MQTNTADDWGAFAGSEHMFYGLAQPYALIRNETEAGLRRQVADSVLDAVKTFEAPKFLTLGRKIGDGSKLLVTHFGFSVRARLYVTYQAGSVHEVIDAALTFLFAHVDRRGSEKSRTYFDVGAEAVSQFTDPVFEQRFLAFKMETAAPPKAEETPAPKAPWWKLWK